MIWLTWRQFRAQAVAAITAVAALAILLAATGPHLASLYAASGIPRCHSSSCGQLADAFLTGPVSSGVFPIAYVLGIACVLLSPVIIGIFWGAPLISREIEAGTLRLAWTQTVSRARWLTTKLALTGLAALVVAGGFSLMVSWWAAPIGRAARLANGILSPFALGPFELVSFDSHGITPLGYAAFAFTLGTAAGLLVRRVVPAMAVTLAIFIAVQIFVPHSIRPHLLPPPERAYVAIESFSPPAGATIHSNSTIHTTAIDLSSGALAGVADPAGATGGITINATTFSVDVMSLASQPGAWILSSGAVNATGHAVSLIPAGCSQPGTVGLTGFLSCLDRNGIRSIAVTYQPASRYWALQWAETAIYLACAAALAGFCFWWVRRRLS